MRRRLTWAILTSVFTTLTLLAILETNDSPQKSSLHAKGKMQIIVHFDLKGAPPLVHYLETLFPLIVAAGATTLLLEYEDMFPFEGTLKNVSALNAYSRKEVMGILSSARRHGLEVIPLVQTFGHLEFVLKLPEFRHLRELDSFPQELCPSNPASLQTLIQELIRQVMELHPDTRFLHIGCDEVFHLGACARCSHRDARALFAKHVAAVARFVRSTYPGVTPLIWDDMLRSWSPADHKQWELGTLVEPVAWVYTDDIHSLLPHYAWYAYRKIYPHVWAAAAYKGASGETAVVPDLQRHHLNTEAWLRIVRNCSECRGLILTGWSRYDHFAVLCELLPVSIPSLVHNLLLSSRGDTRQLARLLSCPQAPVVSLDYDPLQWQLVQCNFPGSDMFAAVKRLVYLKSHVDLMSLQTRGWLTPYNIQHNFSSPMRVLKPHLEVTQLLRELSDFRSSTERILLQYVDRFGAGEWLEQNVQPLQNKMKSLESAIQGLLARETWPRRPFNV